MRQNCRMPACQTGVELSTPAVVENSFAGSPQRRCIMRIRILLQITDDGTVGDTMEVAGFEKRPERPEDLGLSIAEGKTLMAAVQQSVVNAQVTSWTERHRCCEACGVRRRSKGSHPV